MSLRSWWRRWFGNRPLDDYPTDGSNHLHLYVQSKDGGPPYCLVCAFEELRNEVEA